MRPKKLQQQKRWLETGRQDEVRGQQQKEEAEQGITQLRQLGLLPKGVGISHMRGEIPNEQEVKKLRELGGLIPRDEEEAGKPHGNNDCTGCQENTKLKIG